jgi:hypothetical protein
MANRKTASGARLACRVRSRTRRRAMRRRRPRTRGAPPSRRGRLAADSARRAAIEGNRRSPIAGFPVTRLAAFRRGPCRAFSWDRDAERNQLKPAGHDLIDGSYARLVGFGDHQFEGHSENRTHAPGLLSNPPPGTACIARIEGILIVSGFIPSSGVSPEHAERQAA